MTRTLARVDREMTNATQKFEAHSKQRVRDLLDDAGWGNLKEIITDRIPGAIGDEERAFNQSLGESFALLDAQCVEAHHAFTAQFESCYRNLKSLGMAQLHQSIAAIPRTRPLLVDCMYGTPFSAGPRWRDFIGIAWNKDKKREEIRGVVFAAIATHVSRAASHWRGRLATAGSAISAELDRAMQVHLRQYQEAVNAMIREHERRRAALESEQSAMQSYAAQLRERAGELNRFRQSLAAGAAAAQV
jgi:heme oxygenase